MKLKRNCLKIKTRKGDKKNKKWKGKYKFTTKTISSYS